ncbi:MAG: hypothetical protein HN570_06270, partial [Verrucomicrobia bacterium]|nr:hypothetical protein [Verrucomicrobiota bacterium]
MKTKRMIGPLFFSALPVISVTATEPWKISSNDDWTAASASHTGLTLIDGAISPKEEAGTF